MNDMMREMMGVRATKELYPTLMTLPTLSAEQRQTIEAQARARISAGIDEIASAEIALRHANAAGDIGGTEQAASRLSDALNQVKSGTTMLQSLAGETPPQQIASNWFKEQLNLSPAASDRGSGGPFGLSWFHLITMSFVAAFASGMFVIYLIRMRRTNALINRLTSVKPSSNTPGAPVPLAASIPASSSPETTIEPTTAPPAVPSALPGADPASLVVAPQTPTPARGRQWKGRLKVAAIFRETPNVKTFRLRDPVGGQIPFSFVPGQFLTYSAEIGGKLVKRSYTIASSASHTAYIETTVKREDSGVFSEYMHDEIVVGDVVDAMGPSGSFTFQGTEADSVVMIGGGVGITPLMAAIRYLTDIAWPGDIYLVYGARTTEDFIFRDELEYLQRQHLNLHVAATMARAAGTSWMGPEGPITKEFLGQVVPEIAKRRVHLCGPPGMMSAIRKCLTELGVPNEQIKTEAFGPARGAVPPPGITVVEPMQFRANGTTVGLPPPFSITDAAVIGPATASIRFARSNKTAPLPPDQSVLEVAESVGVAIDYACRAGICGTCKTKLLEGKVTMEVEDALTPEDKAQNIILACQAKSIGNLVVEA